MQYGKSAQELPKYKWCQGSSGVAAQRLASWSPPHHLARDQGGWGPAKGTPSPGVEARLGCQPAGGGQLG